MLRKRKPILYLVLCIAIMAAVWAEAQADAAPEPVTEARILRGLKIGTEQSFIATRVREQGVDFTLTPEIEKELKAAGAQGPLIEAIRKAKVIPKAQAETAALVISTDADCTVRVNGTSFSLKAGETKKVPGSPGDNLIQAIAKGQSAISWQHVVPVQPSEQKVVLIELQGQGGNTATDTQNQGGGHSGRAGQTKVNSRDGLTYVWIPPGTFQMGCSPGDNECDSAEKPAHSVTITKGFWLGQTPVTQAAYQRVKGTNPSSFKGDQRPVEEVSWDDAVAYCSAVGLRLPTEAEWEYAARAGSTASRYGDLPSLAWYNDNSGDQTHDVAQKQPNDWKLYDMLGNVWQWTTDWYGGSYYSQSPSQDPHGPTSGTYRVRRGGSWYSVAGIVRVSNRGFIEPSIRYNYYGLRCGGEALP